MTDSKNNPLIMSSSITNCRFCSSSRCTCHNLTPTGFLSSLTTLCSLPIYKALLTNQKNPMQNNNKQKDTYPSLLNCCSESLSTHHQFTIVLHYCVLREARTATEKILTNLITKCSQAFLIARFPWWCLLRLIVI